MTRDSLASPSSSATYPSTMSSRPASALGLTDMQGPKASGRTTRESRPNLSSAGSSPALQASLAHALPARATRQRSNADLRPEKRVTPQASVAETGPRAQRALARPPASPALSVNTMAEDWEAELIKDAKGMQLDPMNREIEERRRRDREWERSGMWNAQRDMAREAEERTRRDAGREIAYPPKIPSVPVRAAATGVTSVHVGVRPRLHPNRHHESLKQNQPDDGLSPPLVTPVEEAANPIAAKAKAQYDDWLSRKSEREEGFGKEADDWHGAGQWTPRERTVARPGAVDGLAHSDAYEAKHFLGTPEHLTPYDQWYQNYWDPTWRPGEQSQGKEPSATDTASQMVQQGDEHGEYEQYDSNSLHFPLMFGTPPMTGHGFGYDQPRSSSYGGIGLGLGGAWSQPFGQSHGAHWAAVNQGVDMGMMGGMPPSAAHAGMGIQSPMGRGQQGNMMMMYPQYAWGMMNGYGMHGGMNPYQMGPMGSQMQQAQVQTAQSQQGGEAFKPYDSSMLKQGRRGHFGFLQGRELAGPPPGHLPAGFSPQMAQMPTPQTPSVRAPQNAWSNHLSKARYDGKVSGSMMNADLDSPYPRLDAGGMASAFTRYGGDQKPMSVDERTAGHRRQREGRV